MLRKGQAEPILFPFKHVLFPFLTCVNTTNLLITCNQISMLSLAPPILLCPICYQLLQPMASTFATYLKLDSFPTETQWNLLGEQKCSCGYKDLQDGWMFRLFLSLY